MTMDLVNDNVEIAPLDREMMLAIMATILLGARIVAVRGQPIVKGEMSTCVEEAQLLLAEVERRCG
jgi:hypothetical protein